MSMLFLLSEIFIYINIMYINYEGYINRRNNQKGIA